MQGLQGQTQKQWDALGFNTSAWEAMVSEAGVGQDEKGRQETGEGGELTELQCHKLKKLSYPSES